MKTISQMLDRMNSERKDSVERRDKIELEIAKKKTGLKYVGSKIVKRKGARVLSIYVMDLDAYMNNPNA